MLSRVRRLRGSSVRVCSADARGRGPRFFGERGDRELAACGALEHVGGLVLRTGVELHEHVNDDLVAVVLVEANVREELTRAVVAEGCVRERLRGVRAGARLDLLGVDRDRA